MTDREQVFVDRRIATHDPPPKGIPNPIHDDAGADAAGYSGALVAGVRTYGWAAEAIIEVVGEGWLSDGWVDFSLRRPLFTGDELTTTVTATAEGWAVACVGVGASGNRVVLDGTCGLGTGSWVGDLTPPSARPAEEPPLVRPTYTIDTVPLGEELRPLGVHVSPDAARRLATDDLGVGHQRYVQGDRPLVSPYFLAARMAPLTRHNFTYGPTIHARSQIQHVGSALSGQDLTITAVIVDAWERNEHWYQVLDGVVSGSDTGDLALLRHHTIFRPRGTTLASTNRPAPIHHP